MAATHYEYNAGNELTREWTAQDDTYYQYDHCGNQTAKQEAAGATYYQYDHEDLLAQIDLADGGHNYFAYDADSKRVAKADAYGTTQFIYQGPNMLALLQERDGTDNAIAHLYHGQRPGGHVAWVSGAGWSAWFASLLSIHHPPARR